MVGVRLTRIHSLRDWQFSRTQSLHSAVQPGPHRHSAAKTGACALGLGPHIAPQGTAEHGKAHCRCGLDPASGHPATRGVVSLAQVVCRGHHRHGVWENVRVLEASSAAVPAAGMGVGDAASAAVGWKAAVLAGATALAVTGVGCKATA